MKTVYALQDKARFFFICASDTLDGFERKVDNAYSNWRGMQPKGSNRPKEDFLKSYTRVKLIIENI